VLFFILSDDIKRMKFYINLDLCDGWRMRIMQHKQNMNLNYKSEKGTTVIEFCGELDNHTATLTKQDLDMIMEKTKSLDYIFDLGNLKFMDSSGIGILLGRYRAIKNNGGSLFVRNINPQIDKVFRVSGLYQVLIKLDKN